MVVSWKIYGWFSIFQGSIFIIEEHGNGYLRISKIEGEAKAAQYIFTRKEQAYAAFAERCAFHQTSPDSHFTQNKFISRPLKNGRITLAGNSLKITEGEVIKKSITFDEAAFGEHLLEWFDIKEAEL